MSVVPTNPISPGQAALDLPEYCSSPLPRSSPPLHPDDDIPAFHTSAGPYLPEDNPNEIFDDYSSLYNAPVPLPTECEVSAFGQDEEHMGSDSEPENFEGEGEYGDDAQSSPPVEGGSAAGDKARTDTGGLNEMDIGTAEARADLEDQDTAADSVQAGLDENVDHAQARRAAAEAYFGPSSEVKDLTEAWSLIDDWWPWPTREDLPTIRQVKSYRERVLEHCGVSPKLINGKHGNLFALNDFAKIIAHEMANPLVRKHMHPFGEDAGPKLKEAWQANRWKDEVSATRWSGLGENTLSPPTPNTKYPFWTSYIEFKADHKYLGWPDPALVSGSQAKGSPKGIARSGQWSADGLEVEACEIIPPNPIRIKANGRRVLPLPIWFYCDDTSGNMSNKHNSLLSTFSGLPREYAEVIYNIHSIATSNLAQHLEMFEAVVEVLRVLSEARKKGLFACDCHYDDFVMLIQWILAMAIDNLMQSRSPIYPTRDSLASLRHCGVVS
ncbi:hypothetical protein HWV62_39171 [Athelia sp. TMB]|nr:hypothetical protein HWV62_39171 [Athelia sp. TMB]